MEKSLGDEDITVTAADKFPGGKKSFLSAPVVTDENGKKLKSGRDYTVTGYYLTDSTSSTLTDFDGTGTVAADTTVTVKIQGTGNYTGTTQTTYRIAAKDISKTKVSVKKVTYTESGVQITAETIADGGLTVTDQTTKENLVYGQDYIITGYKNNDRKGTATLTIQGIGEYGGTKTVKFIIVAKLLKKGWLWHL